MSASPPGHPLRYRIVLGALLGALGLLGVRALYLQVWNSDYLREQGDARHLRVVEDASHRGMILDRNGEPLAISTPVDSVWVNPAEFSRERQHWSALSRLLGISTREMATQLAKYAGREFMYLKRQIAPELADQVMALQIPGVALQREYRRYYPAGAVAAQVVGFTNIDDRGQEGLEFAYDQWLRGVPGRKRVLKDRFGNVVEVAESLTLPVPGKDLVTSIDSRIQYLTYRELKKAIAAHNAHSGIAIVMDAKTGEVLAMVDEPTFNPNNRAQYRSRIYRDRAVTDVVEPGSTIKPFTIAAALESGKFTPDTLIPTAPGVFKVGANVIHDTHDYGTLTVSQVIEKSSNVGASKISFAIGRDALWDKFRQVGFGSYTGSGLPGESLGILDTPNHWVPIQQATMSFGYGVSVTPLQLARAYCALANGGRLLPVSLLRLDKPPTGVRVIPEPITLEIRKMLEMAVSSEGTGSAAQVPYYKVAGKTGTAHMLVDGAYAKDEYLALFAGFAPASDPRLVMVVMIDDPTQGGYYGGEVAAPVFGHVMAGALRLMDIPPDGMEKPVQRMAQVGKGPLS